eukprot:1161057-Pelagomonas_calceolata.AAC.1
MAWLLRIEEGRHSNWMLNAANNISSINSHRNLFTHLDQSKHWQNARKAIAPAFSAKAIKSYFPIIR